MPIMFNIFISSLQAAAVQSSDIATNVRNNQTHPALVEYFRKNPNLPIRFLPNTESGPIDDNGEVGRVFARGSEVGNSGYIATRGVWPRSLFNQVWNCGENTCDFTHEERDGNWIVQINFRGDYNGWNERNANAGDLLDAMYGDGGVWNTSPMYPMWSWICASDVWVRRKPFGWLNVHVSSWLA